jgi:hypothetical protein
LPELPSPDGFGRSRPECGSISRRGTRKEDPCQGFHIERNASGAGVLLERFILVFPTRANALADRETAFLSLISGFAEKLA